MNNIQFDWDEKKNIANQKKHAISFEEAKTVFYDQSDEEERFVLLGMAQSLQILIVCHCYRKNDEIIRIISARKANKDEIYQYGGVTK